MQGDSSPTEDAFIEKKDRDHGSSSEEDVGMHLFYFKIGKSEFEDICMNSDTSSSEGECEDVCMHPDTSSSEDDCKDVSMHSKSDLPVNQYVRNEFNNFKTKIALICGVGWVPLKNSAWDETVDLDFSLRCKAYMRDRKCHKGGYCGKLHTFPWEDKIVCKYYKAGACERGAAECWFWHPFRLTL